MSKKKIILPILALSLFVFAFYTSTKVKAQDSAPRSPLVQKIIDRFNLDTDEVDGLITDFRQERRQEMQANFERRLDDLVSDGKITEDQKQAILVKRESLHSSWEEVKNLSPEERQQQRESHQAELKAWAEENGLSSDDLGLFGLGGKGMGMGRKGGHGLGMHRDW